MLLLIGFPVLSLAGSNDFNVVEYYSELSESYNISISEKNYDRALKIAIEQLALDPADSIAYLRAAIASQYVDTDRTQLIEMYSHAISERDNYHIQIKTLANVILQN